MIPVDLTGKIALVTGVGDNKSFAWYIAKALNAAGAKVVLGVHPRMVNIVESFLSREQDAESRILPFGKGSLMVEKVIACDVAYDTLEDAPEDVRSDRRYAKFGDFSIANLMKVVGAEFGGIDVLIHSIAFSREIKKSMLETSRAGYLEALSISAYSLTALVRAAEPLMANRPEGAAVLGLTYLGGARVVPHYGGGMSSAKAALEIDAKQLAYNVGSKNIRVNLISAGPYASRAATAIGEGTDNSIFKMIEYAAARSPLPRGITPEEVANTTAFLCSPLASGITAQVIYVDCGYNSMGV